MEADIQTTRTRCRDEEPTTGHFRKECWGGLPGVIASQTLFVFWRRKCGRVCSFGGAGEL
jgi:hypothetical protein